MQTKPNFNLIAPYYDWLCQLVFGKQVKNAQIESLQYIQANSTILIAGGGTGWILDEISKIHPAGLHITYVDISSKMMALSKKRNIAFNTVTYINDSIENITLPDQNYDVIITPFFLDCFSQSTFQSVFKILDKSMKNKGLWLYIDFCLPAEKRTWQRILIKIMYAFFRLTCKIEATKLPPVEICFAHYTIMKKKMFCRDIIIMQVFQKT
jgi:ubiquinone/menaquinone biosynthesis C-methylase UbiE